MLCTVLPILCTARFYSHHYEEYMDLSCFDEAAETVSNIIAQYRSVDNVTVPPPVTRMKPRGLSFL
jgi:tubulin epsilon